MMIKLASVGFLELAKCALVEGLLRGNKPGEEE
jgi:hypothetical protein